MMMMVVMMMVVMVIVMKTVSDNLTFLESLNRESLG